MSRKKKWMIMAGSILVVVATALTLTFSGHLGIPLPFFASHDGAKPETYVSIGPLMSSMDSGELIKMTLDIECTKKSYRKTITAMDTEIRNRLILAFQTATADKLMAAGDYFALRAYLSDSVMEIIPEGTVNNIYISQLLRY